MENINTNNTERMTLPGVAGAPSGANAGGDSFPRAVGGQELAGALTGSPEENTTRNGNITTDQPVLSVLSTDIVPTTNAGLVRQRIKWTATMNKAIMRAYFIATKLETNMTAYRSDMRRIFTTEQPQLQRLSEQNISDRRRAIVNRHLLTEVEIYNTRIEAENVLREMEARHTHERYGDETNENNSEREQSNLNGNNNEGLEYQNLQQNLDSDSIASSRRNEEEAVDLAEAEQLRIAFNAAMLEFKDVEPASRHIIPRLYPNSKVEKYIKIINLYILPQYLSANISLERLCCLIYISAVSIARTMNFKTKPRNGRQERTDRNLPRWEERLVRKVESLRKDMGRLTEYINGITTKKLKKHVAKIIHPISVEEITVQDVINIRDIKRQSLAAYAKRLSRYRESRNRKNQNIWFHKNEKAFYRKLDCQQHEPNEQPNIVEMTEYWSALWSHEKNV